MTDIRPQGPLGPLNPPIPPRPPAPVARPPAPGPVKPVKAGRKGDRLATTDAAGALVARGEEPLDGLPEDRDWTFDSRQLPAGPGEYVLLRSAEGDFELQGTQEEAPGGEVATTRLAVKVDADGHTVTYDARNGQLGLDGQAAEAGSGATVPCGEAGGVTHWGRGFYTVDSAAGDSVSFFDLGGKLDFSGSLAPARAGAAYGLLGAFGMAGPGGGSRMMPDGEEAADAASFAASWRVQPE